MYLKEGGGGFEGKGTARGRERVVDDTGISTLES